MGFNQTRAYLNSRKIIMLPQVHSFIYTPDNPELTLHVDVPTTIRQHPNVFSFLSAA